LRSSTAASQYTRERQYQVQRANFIGEGFFTCPSVAPKRKSPYNDITVEMLSIVWRSKDYWSIMLSRAPDSIVIVKRLIFILLLLIFFYQIIYFLSHD
jgi:hypothetical protein